ncbi:MAG: protein translocase subunit SecF, partial [bacterium]
MQFFRNAHFNFIGMRRRVMPISLTLILAGMVSVAVHKGFNTSIDFAGGTLVEVQFENPVPLDEV